MANPIKVSELTADNIQADTDEVAVLAGTPRGSRRRLITGLRPYPGVILTEAPGDLKVSDMTPGGAAQAADLIPVARAGGNVWLDPTAIAMPSPGYSKPPDVSSLTIVNQGTALVQNIAAGLTIRRPAGAPGNVSAVVPIPGSVPWSFTIAMSGVWTDNINTTAGIVAADGNTASAKLLDFCLEVSSAFRIQRWTSSTVFASTTVPTNVYYGRYSDLWMRYEEDATNRVCSISIDGEWFIPLFSEVKTTHLTATHVGIHLSGGAGNRACQMICHSWKLVP